MFSLQVQKMTLATKTKAIESAKKAAKEYCIKNELSLEKLSSQIFLYFGDYVGIMQEMPYKGGGLTEDIASQPKPTLTFDVKKNMIFATEYTKQYLA